MAGFVRFRTFVEAFSKMHGTTHQRNLLISSRRCSSKTEQSDSHQPPEEEFLTEDELKTSILDAALNFVPSHGWTVSAIAKGAQEHGYPGVTHGLFPRGGGDLMHHFVRQCNTELSEQLKSRTQATDGPSPGQISPSLLREAIEMRLRMLIPYMDQWPEALALTAQPSNVQEHFTNLCKLIDDVCYHSGDRSVDFSWYTKRLALLGVYKSCELHIIQDKSHDYQETWDFLDRRLDDYITAGKIKQDVERIVNPEFFSAVYTVGRNILGVNDQRRYLGQVKWVGRWQSGISVRSTRKQSGVRFQPSARFRQSCQILEYADVRQMGT